MVKGCVSLSETCITGGFQKIVTGKGPAAEVGPFLLLGQGEGTKQSRSLLPGGTALRESRGSQWGARNGSLVAASGSHNALSVPQ